MSNDLICMENIHKYFGKVHALSGVNFEMGFNEIVGLIGDNGAGKSTLIKILSGVFPPTKGRVKIKGQVINSGKYSVKKARKIGIETVYQEQALGIKQSLWRNVFVGRELTNRAGLIKTQVARHETDHIMRDFLGFTSKAIKPDSRVSTLSGGERQGLAIGRAMYFEANLIILDEPTNALSVKEVNKVLKFIQQIKDQGKACVYISHRISDIYSVSDRFVIMDRGKVVGEYNRADISETELTGVLVHHSTTMEVTEHQETSQTEEDKL